MMSASQKCQGPAVRAPQPSPAQSDVEPGMEPNRSGAEIESLDRDSAHGGHYEVHHDARREAHVDQDETKGMSRWSTFTCVAPPLFDVRRFICLVWIHCTATPTSASAA